MITLKKDSKKDFTILNLTDPQLSDSEWEDGHSYRKILEYTVSELIKRTKPDLITISGDLAWAGHDYAYKQLALLLEQFQIPWAPVWGNHDNQGGAEYIDKIATDYLSYPHCVYEKGDAEMGNGNYVVCIEEDGKIVEALFMMDSHDRDDCVDGNGNIQKVYLKLTEKQMQWYREQTKFLKAKGCKDSTMILHIPIYAFCVASRAAYKTSVSLKDLALAQAEGTECWKEGYIDSVGVQHEAIGSHPENDGVFAIIKEEGLTKTIVAGHDHVNNWMIRYEGVTMVYALKTGAGCYWEPCMNGGTVLKVNNNGVYDILHEYVDVSHLL